MPDSDYYFATFPTRNHLKPYLQINTVRPQQVQCQHF